MTESVPVVIILQQAIPPSAPSPDSMASSAATCPDDVSVAALLLRAATIVPTAHYLASALILLLVFIYNFLEIHLLRDLLRGFRGDPVSLTFHPSSKIYEGVVSKCQILHGRYLVTPWLASPHLQTVFLNFFGRPPTVVYRRQLFSVHDGGTVALDWLLASDVAGGSSVRECTIAKDDSTPIVVVVPGLTSDSFSPYLRHATYSLAKHGWNVVVSNHRGLAGVSLTSDYLYNAGWTGDVREVINYLHCEYPKAPLFAVGTSIGANILVKYLGEDGENTPIAAAASICSPWDLVVGDRFISRRFTQRLYDKALAIGLKGYAQLHQSALTRLANWEGIRKSHSVRDFDNHATCHVGKFETVDTYYRCCSSVSFIRTVAVPLLCISALDDPVCTREAIPWDECRVNKNIVLATTTHGGHLAYFKGLIANRLWWVGATVEYLNVLYSSPFMHQQKKTPNSGLHHTLESDIVLGPYINITEDGMVSAMTSEEADHAMEADLHDDGLPNIVKSEQEVMLGDQRLHGGESNNENKMNISHEPVDSLHKVEVERIANPIHDITAPVKRSLSRLSRHYNISMWLLAYIAILTTWPVLGSAVSFVFRKKLRGFLPTAWLRR